MDDKSFIEAHLYKKIKETLPIPTVDVVIFNSDFSKILLFKRNNPPLKDKYYSIGGRMHKMESFLDCAVRKVKEEIGIDINKNSLVKSGVNSEEFEENGIEYHFINIYFYFILKENSNLILDSQHSKFKWFDFDDKEFHPYIKEKIIKCTKMKNEK